MKKIKLKDKVQSLCTLAFVGTCCYGFIVRTISAEVFVPLVTLVITSLYKKNEISKVQEEEEEEEWERN